MDDNAIKSASKQLLDVIDEVYIKVEESRTELKGDINVVLGAIKDLEEKMDEIRDGVT